MGKFKTIPNGWMLMSEAAKELGLNRNNIYKKKKILKATKKHPSRPGVWLVSVKEVQKFHS